MGLVQMAMAVLASHPQLVELLQHTQEVAVQGLT
jgi:hypothetical protein